MSKYESVIIIRPNLSKHELSEITLKLENKISEFATIIQKEDYGKKTLAYEIKGNKQGHYFVYQFDVDDNNKEKALKELEYFYRITDEIIRYIMVECEEKR